MLSRGQWKRIRAREGLPEGERHGCGCGGLVIFEKMAETVVLHHTLPWCSRFSAIIDRHGKGVEFHVLSKVDASEAERALAELGGRA